MSKKSSRSLQGFMVILLAFVLVVLGFIVSAIFKEEWPAFYVFVALVAFGLAVGSYVLINRESLEQAEFAMAVFDFLWVAGSVGTLFFIYRELYVNVLSDGSAGNEVKNFQKETYNFKSVWIVIYSAIIGMRLSKALFDLRQKKIKVNFERDNSFDVNNIADSSIIVEMILKRNFVGFRAACIFAVCSAWPPVYLPVLIWALWLALSFILGYLNSVWWWVGQKLSVLLEYYVGKDPDKKVVTEAVAPTVAVGGKLT